MQSKRKNVDKRKIFLWCAAAGIVLCAVLFCLWHNRTALAEQRVERALSVTVSQPEPRLAQEDNTETGAWITVPGTNIDAPVQQASDNDYYLRRDTAGNADVHGCVFADYACDLNSTSLSRNLGRDKPKFRQYLLRSQPVLFRFEGTEYKIAVEDVALFPQGYAALLTDPDLLLDEPSLLLMDIGGWTVDLMRIDNARPVAETAHSLEFGMIRCIDAVREQVRRETGLSLTDAQIEQMLAGGPCALGDSVREIVRQQGRAYTERLFALVTEAGFDLRALPTVMLGGGAGIVQRHVGPKDGLCRAMFLPDDKVNAVGFERALAQLSGRVSEG